MEDLIQNYTEITEKYTKEYLTLSRASKYNLFSEKFPTPPQMNSSKSFLVRRSSMIHLTSLLNFLRNVKVNWMVPLMTIYNRIKP